MKTLMNYGQIIYNDFLFKDYLLVKIKFLAFKEEGSDFYEYALSMEIITNLLSNSVSSKICFIPCSKSS